MNRSVMAASLVGAVILLGNASPLGAQEPAYDPEARLAELGIELPEAPSPVASYVNGVQTGNLIFLAGKGPLRADGSEVRGKLGADISIEEGYEAARLTAINQLSVLKAMLGDLSRVVRVVKVLGMVNSDPDFVEQPAVINGFSDLIVQVFGDRGRHARAAVGMASLPRGQSVEIEMVVEVAPGPVGGPEAGESPLELTYFGAAGWRISDGNVVVLVDPWPSRLKYGGGGHPDDDRPDFARDEAPLRIDQFIEGGSLSFFARFDRLTVLTVGSMNFIEREFEGLEPDILLAGINGSRVGLYDYDRRLLEATGFPRVVIPTHWDNFRLPYDFSQQANVERNILPFIETAREVSPGSTVITPVHLEPIQVH